MVGFIFIGPNSLSRGEVYAAVNHVTQAVVGVGSKIESYSPPVLFSIGLTPKVEPKIMQLSIT